MNKISVKIILSALSFSLLLVACGNKGPLVKPEQQTAEAEAEAKK